jgi:hypothetical protein
MRRSYHHLDLNAIIQSVQFKTKPNNIYQGYYGIEIKAPPRVTDSLDTEP